VAETEFARPDLCVTSVSEWAGWRPACARMKQYQRLFEYEKALARKVGARGLRMILEELMLDLMYHLPSNKRVRDLEITKDMVERRDLSLCLLEKAG